MYPVILDYPERVKRGITRACVTGSILVKAIVPHDIDYVLLFEDQLRLDEFLAEHGGKTNTSEYDTDGMDMCRSGQYNYLCTVYPEIYWRWVAFSGVLDRLQLKDREHRVSIAIACTEWSERLTVEDTDL